MADRMFYGGIILWTYLEWALSNFVFTKMFRCESYLLCKCAENCTSEGEIFVLPTNM